MVKMKPTEVFKKVGVVNPWLRKPTVPPKDHGWFHGNNREALEEIFQKEQPKVVLEIGSWLGRSTIFFAERAELVVAVDTWIGSPNHWVEKWAGLLPVFYETFLRNCWDYRAKIAPLRMASAIALIKLQEIPFDLVYIDGDHSPEGFRRDLQGAKKLARSPVICGDDYRPVRYPGVVNGLKGEKVEVRKPFWRIR